jgi:ferredoxin
MPILRIYKKNDVFESIINANVNLVVQAGIKKFPFPHLKYKCGMGTCGTCMSKIISGAEFIDGPNWKEVKILKDKLKLGYRLMCQFRVFEDLEIEQL